MNALHLHRIEMILPHDALDHCHDLRRREVENADRGGTNHAAQQVDPPVTWVTPDSQDFGTLQSCQSLAPRASHLTIHFPVQAYIRERGLRLPVAAPDKDHANARPISWASKRALRDRALASIRKQFTRSRIALPARLHSVEYCNRKRRRTCDRVHLATVPCWKPLAKLS